MFCICTNKPREIAKPDEEVNKVRMIDIACSTFGLEVNFGAELRLKNSG
jgi:hypothetical protein